MYHVCNGVQNCEMRLLDPSCHHFHRLSLRNEQLSLERLWIIRKYHMKINISLKSDKNIYCVTPAHFIFVVSFG